MAKTIDQKKVTLFCKRARALTKVGKKQTKERDEIVAALIAGQELPTGGPWVIDLSPNGGKEKFNWRDAYEDVLTKVLTKKHKVSEKVGRAMAQSQMDEIEAKQPDKTPVEIAGVKYVGGVKLTPKVNEQYHRSGVVIEEAVA